MNSEFNEEHLRLAGGQAAAALAPQVAGLQAALGQLQAPWWATVNLQVPLGDRWASVVFRCMRTPEGACVDEHGVEASHGFTESLALGMLHGGTVAVRQELALRVQRPNARGQMEWGPQDRVYGCQLGQRDWTPVPEAQVRRAHAFDAQTGQPLPQVAGRGFGVLRKPKTLG